MCLAYTVKCMHPPPTGGLCDFTVLCGVPKWGSGKESACRCRRLRFNPWVRKSPWCRKWQPIPEFLPGKFHGQRSLEGYSPWVRQESDMTEWLSMHAQYCTEYSIFILSPECPEAKVKAAVIQLELLNTHTHTHTHQEIKMETKVKIIERVKKDGRCHSTIYMNYPTISMSLKNRTRSWTYEVSCADDVNNNIKAYKSDGRNGETFQCVDTGSASALSPAQLNADSRES